MPIVSTEAIQKLLKAHQEWDKTRRTYFEALISAEAAEKRYLLAEDPHRLVALRNDRLRVLPLHFGAEQSIGGNAQLPEDCKSKSNDFDHEEDTKQEA